MTLYARYGQNMTAAGEPKDKPFFLTVEPHREWAFEVGHLHEPMRLWVEAVEVPDPATVALRAPDVVHDGVCPTCGRTKEGGKG